MYLDGATAMADILVRNLSEETVKELKRQAEQNGRSFQAEVRVLLEEAVQRPKMSMAEFRKLAEKMCQEVAGREHSDSGVLQAEDRAR
jgi:plasmid stability protein